jgi:hypothetical protein
MLASKLAKVTSDPSHTLKGQRHEMDISKSKKRISTSVFAHMVFNLGFTKSLINFLIAYKNYLSI